MTIFPNQTKAPIKSKEPENPLLDPFFAVKFLGIVVFCLLLIFAIMDIVTFFRN